MVSMHAALRSQNTDPLYESFFQSETAELPGARNRLFDTANLSNFQLSTGPAAARMEKVRVDGMPFSVAFRISVTRTGTNSWEPQFMTANSAASVNQGDVLFYILYSRAPVSSDPSGKGKCFAYVQLSRSPWSGLGSLDIGPDSTWRKYCITAVADRDYAKGDVQLTIHLGFFAQTVEIGGLIALNLGKVDVNLLPVNPITYEGREPGAPWRAAARNRIEQHRKADLGVRVTDPYGRPVPYATVRVKMTRHAFGFGTFLPRIELDNPGDTDRYLAAVFKYFNKVTTPFYWGHETGTWGWESTGSAEYRRDCLDLAAWEKANGFRIRGHNLVWPGWEWLPPRIKGLENDKDALGKAVLEHIREVVGLTKQFGFEEWDVVNEPYFNHDLMDILGEDVLVDWFKTVHEIDPAPSPVVNETGDITGGGHAAALDNLSRLTEMLLAAGAPLGGLGLQAHFGGNLTSIQTVLDIFDRFERYGLPLRITEFDIDTRDTDAQADYTRDLLFAVFSHPALDNFTMWGFWEGDHWKPNGAMIRRNWTRKPNALAYEHLVLDDWWTDASGAADAEGRFSTRAFLGDYRVSAFRGADSAFSEVRLGKAGTAVDLILPDSTMAGRFVLADPFPNPFRDSVRIGIHTPGPSTVTADLFDGRGRCVKRLHGGPFPVGFHLLFWDGTEVAGRPAASGVYVLRVTVETAGKKWSETKRIAHAK
jgi:GH35 family endo-1,4-beta-xylanase